MEQSCFLLSCSWGEVCPSVVDMFAPPSGWTTSVSDFVYDAFVLWDSIWRGYLMLSWIGNCDDLQPPTWETGCPISIAAMKRCQFFLWSWSTNNHSELMISGINHPWKGWHNLQLIKINKYSTSTPGYLFYLVDVRFGVAGGCKPNSWVSGIINGIVTFQERVAVHKVKTLARWRPNIGHDEIDFIGGAPNCGIKWSRPNLCIGDKLKGLLNKSEKSKCHSFQAWNLRHQPRRKGFPIESIGSWRW